jgi:hypothetical protein
VHLRARIAGDLGDTTFHSGVDVLIGRSEDEPSISELGLDHIERLKYPIAFMAGNDLGARQPTNMGTRPSHIVGPEALVERQALRIRQELG